MRAPVLFALVFLASPLQAQGLLSSPVVNGSLRVSGEAEVRVVPDEAVLRLGVESFNETLAAASAANQATIASLVEVARGHGVADEHVQTEYVHVEPLVQTHRSGQAVYEVYGYRVRRAVVVTLRDLDAFDDLLHDAVAVGVTHVQDVAFQTTRLREARDEARAQAADAAREKAEVFASRLGRQVGPALSISESNYGWGTRYGSGWDAVGSGYAAQNVAQSGGADMSLGPVTSPGQIAVRARVDVTFTLE